mmetsp:Transcript_20327/g.38665  ORF Transcript_20327/g.38665 Transcript_20327/m.38665 type:complete len:256 (-) Transcript_20327:1628-2395(-)
MQVLGLHRPVRAVLLLRPRHRAGSNPGPGARTLCARGRHAGGADCQLGGLRARLRHSAVPHLLARRRSVPFVLQQPGLRIRRRRLLLGDEPRCHALLHHCQPSGVPGPSTADQRQPRVAVRERAAQVPQKDPRPGLVRVVFRVCGDHHVHPPSVLQLRKRQRQRPVLLREPPLPHLRPGVHRLLLSLRDPRRRGSLRGWYRAHGHEPFLAVRYSHRGVLPLPLHRRRTQSLWRRIRQAIHMQRGVRSERPGEVQD